MWRIASAAKLTFTFTLIFLTPHYLPLSDNPFIKNAGIDVIANPLHCVARQLPAPGVVFRERSATASLKKELHHVYPQQGKWKFERPLVRPARFTVWAMYWLLTERDQAQTQTQTQIGSMVMEFVKRLRNEAAAKGVELNEPADCRVGVDRERGGEMKITLSY